MLIGSLLLMVSTGIAFDLLVHADRYQRDLSTYYFAGKAFALGLNPYDIDVLSALAPAPIPHRFVYPPYTLWLFRLLPVVDFTTVYYLFLAIKAMVLVLLFYLWKRAFLPEMNAPFFIFALLAYNAAVYVDLRVGNIAIFEGLLIWLAFLFYLRNRLLPFSLLIVIAASFKLTPIFFLLLLLWSESRGKYLQFAGSVMLFLVIQIASWYAAPGLYTAFLQNLSGLDERGVINPSTLALIQDLSDWGARNTGIAVPETAQLGLFLALTAIVILVSWRAHRALTTGSRPENGRVALFLACLAYALIMPRLKTYSYLILLVPTYFMLLSITYLNPLGLFGYLRRYGFLVAFTIFSSLYTLSGGQEPIGQSLLGYSPLLAAYSIWVLYVRESLTLAKEQDLPSPLPESYGERVETAIVRIEE
ncbi:MAG: DUF2029 domain-containing protein [Chloroflexi bacterium]|nr:DUF2029 domain-containing protein [Chloroflexota bacterium]